tara:strand:+ start:3172 stop:3276 length:105 start_codon:yes stop_codon:yes gene_type:complete
MARNLGGKWLLRIDDLEASKNRIGTIDIIQRDLS